MNDTANFDPESFMNDEVEGEMSTRGLPVPEGEHQGVANKIDFKQGTSEKGNDWTAMDVTWEILNDPELNEKLGRTPTVRQRLFLDVDRSGKLDTAEGKNTGLGRLREATGTNNPGPFKLTDIIGKTATLNVSHRMYEGEIYDEVKRVSSAQT